MGTHTTESNCEICDGRTILIEDTHYDSSEEHCLNENCRHYNVDSGTMKDEGIDAFGGVGFDTPEGWKDMLECFGYKKCEKCGDANMHFDDDSLFCEECE